MCRNGTNHATMRVAGIRLRRNIAGFRWDRWTCKICITFLHNVLPNSPVRRGVSRVRAASLEAELMGFGLVCVPRSVTCAGLFDDLAFVGLIGGEVDEILTQGAELGSLSLTDADGVTVTVAHVDSPKV